MEWNRNMARRAPFLPFSRCKPLIIYGSSLQLAKKAKGIDWFAECDNKYVGMWW